MIFQAFSLSEAVGVVLAHSLRLPGGAIKKGRVLDAADVAALRDADYHEVIGARLEPGDLAEDNAAAAAAALLAGPGVAVSAAKTGRCNLTATTAGVFTVDRCRVDALNAVDESLTVATLPAWEVVTPGQIVATVKVIPFAVAGTVLGRWRALADTPPLAVAALKPTDVGLVLSRLPGMKESVLDATAAVTRARLHALGSRLVFERRVAHGEQAIRAAIDEALAAGCGMVMVSGASATVDRRDVVPAAIVAAGGSIEHFGMPVDPGNLLLLAHIGAVPVIDMPGCGRSPKLNGLDWVLARVLAEQPIGAAEIKAMGVGGLLKDIAARPLPRERAVRAEAPPPAPPRIAALVLAAGQSRRMGANKLLVEVQGRPLVSHAVDAALASVAAPVLVVTGHEAEQVRVALAGRAVTFVDNPDFGEGMAASLRHGFAALPADIDGVVVCLGDMPAVTAAHIDRLVAAFAPGEGRAICVSVHEGKRGNPVLIGRRFFPEVARLAGDVGARHIIAANADLVAEVAMPDAAILLDVDTPEALRDIAPPAPKRAEAEGDKA